MLSVLHYIHIAAYMCTIHYSLHREGLHVLSLMGVLVDGTIASDARKTPSIPSTPPVTIYYACCSTYMYASSAHIIIDYV